METLGLIFSMVATAIGATWVLKAELSGMRGDLRAHTDKDEVAFAGLKASSEDLKGRVVQLESRRKAAKK